MPQFFGKYRGLITNDVDPQRRGRIEVVVPAISERRQWALPCVPYAGPGVGFLATPPIGANIWVEFEQGNPDLPIWSGCFWGTGELPKEVTAVRDVKIFKTESHSIMLTSTKMLLQMGLIEIELSDDGIRLLSNPAILRLSTQNGIELKNNQASVKVVTNGIELNGGGSAAAKVAPLEIDLSNGAASINLAPAIVNINKGALEVL